MRLRPVISFFWAAVFTAVASLTGCSLIDEDITSCNNQVRLTYELRLDPEIIQELEDELDLHADEDIRAMLKEYIDGVFTNYARGVDLFFYDTEDPMDCLRQLSEKMNSSSNTYSLSMPVRSYLHTAITNIASSECVHIFGEENFPTERLDHEPVDGYYTPQRCGIFAVRRRIDIGEKANQRVRTRLTMVNSATALILDMGKATNVTDVRVEVEGMATSFNIADSTYTYAPGAVFSTDEFDIGYKFCYAAVHFPSQDPPEGEGDEDEDLEPEGTKATELIDEEPGDDTEHKLWRWKVYATLKDGSITLSTLEMRPPVKAGQLKIRNAFVWDDGEVRPNEVDVSVDVKLDWKPGLDIEVPL